jgi:hypothetical protein
MKYLIYFLASLSFIKCSEAALSLRPKDLFQKLSSSPKKRCWETEFALSHFHHDFGELRSRLFAYQAAPIESPYALKNHELSLLTEYIDTLETKNPFAFQEYFLPYLKDQWNAASSPERQGLRVKYHHSWMQFFMKASNPREALSPALGQKISLISDLEMNSSLLRIKPPKSMAIIQTVLTHPAFSQLQSLNLSGNELHQLTEAFSQPSVHETASLWTPIDYLWKSAKNEKEHLFLEQVPSKIHTLFLNHNQLNSESLTTILHFMRERQAPLRHLSLRGNYLSPYALQELLRSPYAKEIETLNLAGNPLAAARLITILATSPTNPLPKLKALSLEDNNLRFENIVHLAYWEGLEHLHSLNITDFNLPEEDRQQLAAINIFKHLTRFIY